MKRSDKYALRAAAGRYDGWQRVGDLADLPVTRLVLSARDDTPILLKLKLANFSLIGEIIDKCFRSSQSRLPEDRRVGGFGAVL